MAVDHKYMKYVRDFRILAPPPPLCHVIRSPRACDHAGAAPDHSQQHSDGEDGEDKQEGIGANEKPENHQLYIGRKRGREKQ